MIHVRKSENPPPELATKGYKDDAVKSQLLQDQHEKCYLCERRLHTNYQVEHLKSRKNYPALENEWSNLFMACEYCNGKKLEDYDDILNPADVPVEGLISQKYDAKNETFYFEAVGETSDSVAMERTIDLLHILFNGKNPKMLNLKETRFRQEIRIIYNAFQQLLNEYLANDGDAEKKQAIEESLDSQSECLGLKYWLVESIPQLKDKCKII